MRWDNLLADRDDSEERARLPIFADEAVVRRFKTPEFKGMTFYEVNAKSIINHVPGDRFGFNWTINPYRGCSHACRFCFARPTHTYLDFNAGEDFDKKIVVKVNAVDLVRRELRKKSWGGEQIAMGTNTDPYQRAEGHYKLMRGILGELNSARNPYSILTKGTLIQRDIDLLQEGAAKMDVTTNFSVGTVDEDVWKRSEPGTPHPRRRLEVVKKLNEAGIPCGVLMAPILPGISDSPEQLEATVRAIAESGATHILPIVLYLRPGVKEEFMPWLEREYPHLVQNYRATYVKSNAPKDVSREIGGRVSALKSRYGAFEKDRKHAPRRQERVTEEAPSEDVEQMSLDLSETPRKAPKWARVPS
ncbi:MAG TPA: Rv2578c family radical SAM protein [Actinomycetota bacterium]|nr:Rv2578c family radical SAM protein [Actinomycetota bacterium]